jgi:hypothetical protein
MNWEIPTTKNHPPFNQVILGLQLPNKVKLVKLDRIDKTGLVFVAASENPLISEFASIFGGLSKTINDLELNESIKIDQFCIIELPVKTTKTNK